MFDPSLLKAKRRYEINKGQKNFDVNLINAFEYKEQLFAIAEVAYATYPEKYLRA